MMGQNAWPNIIGSDRAAGHSRGMSIIMFNLYFTNLRTKIIDKLGLSYHSVKELNDMINMKLPGRPPFECKVLNIGDEWLEFYCHDILECIQSLYGNPNFVQDMAFTLE
jgi:hypothetical protein